MRVLRVSLQGALVRATEDASAEAMLEGWTADCLRALPLHDGLPFLPDRRPRVHSGSATLQYGAGMASCAGHPGSEFLWRERPAFAAQFTRSNGGVIATRHCDNSGRTCRFSASVTHA